MDIKRYIAITKAQLSALHTILEQPAWMACQFSPYGTGLSNLPEVFPEGSMIILNDKTPFSGHDPQLIISQLNTLSDKFKTNLFLFDFQRQKNKETEDLLSSIANKINGTVAVTEPYADNLDYAVFLTCPLPHQTLSDKIKPWNNREIWLELAAESEYITISKADTQIHLSNETSLNKKDAYDKITHSRYRIEVFKNEARIIIERTPDVLEDLILEARSYGVKITVGLYQQLYHE